MQISEKIMRLRKKRSLSQEKLAVKIGVGKDTVDKWEQGILEPDKTQIRKLALALNVDPDYLTRKHPSIFKVLIIHMDRITKRHRLAVVVTAAVSLCVSFGFFLLAMQFESSFCSVMAIISILVACLAFIFHGRNKK